MSKYAELCQALAIAKSNYEEYEKECVVFAEDFWKEIIAYYKVPKKSISLHYIDEFGEIEVIKPPLINAMQLRNDAYFEFGIGINLCGQEQAELNETFILPINIAIDTEGKHKLRLGEYGEIFFIDLKIKNRYHDFLDKVHESIKSSYLDGLTEIRSKSSPRRIGFK